MFETVEDVIDVVARALLVDEADALFLVGGAVRDEFACLPIKDLDFATNLLPDVIHDRFTMAVASELPVLSVYNVGMERGGTVGAIIDRGDHGITVEVTPMRSECYPHGDRRRPEVVFADDIVADLSRRDFTINALAYNVRTGHVLDPFHGVKDMQDAVLRSVGVASDRLVEDPVRIIRAARFLSKFDIAPDVELVKAIEDHTDKLKLVTEERMFKELNAMLVQNGVFRGLSFLYATHALDVVLPEVVALAGLQQPPKYHDHDAMMHTFHAVHAGASYDVDLLMRWALLLHDTGKVATYDDSSGTPHFYGHETESAKLAEEILLRFKAPRRFIESVVHLVGGHMKSHRVDFLEGKQVRRFINKMDLVNPGNGVLMVSAEDFSVFAMLDTIASNQDRATTAPLAHAVRMQAIAEARDYLPPVDEDLSPFTGEQIMELLGIKPGKPVGDAKKFLVQQVIDGHIEPGDGKKAAELLTLWFYDYNVGEETA